MTRLIFLAAALCLAACSSEPEEGTGESDVGAKGEILGGTINDDMLPFESVTSRSPQLADAPETEASADGSDLQPEAEQTVPATGSEPVPAAEPAPAPAPDAATATTDG